MTETPDQLIARVEADCALRHPELGSVTLSTPEARRLLALARKGLEAAGIEHDRDWWCKQAWEQLERMNAATAELRAVKVALESALAPKEPPHA